MIFFEKKEGRAEAWTDKLWVYDLRTNLHFTLKQSPIQRKDFDEFIACYKPGRPHERNETWSEQNSEGRWRSYDYEELLKPSPQPWGSSDCGRTCVSVDRMQEHCERLWETAQELRAILDRIERSLIQENRKTREWFESRKTD